MKSQSSIAGWIFGKRTTQRKRMKDGRTWRDLAKKTKTHQRL